MLNDDDDPELDLVVWICAGAFTWALAIWWNWAVTPWWVIGLVVTMLIGTALAAGVSFKRMGE